ncbi:DNA polymerase III subunit alpha [Candidatus Gracilibacteria bacterium]|nr:DNA polymerase III subunit alpha [Candidatus Gracilibacteria bacterium]MCF7856185.1 DNA polymerase III subunit alpha [Candidatus Gracilibacteria bacterium]MCF7896457.1 DNA polymerase III subunit alpha [Candidatus Gracilibacteria bacterium]
MFVHLHNHTHYSLLDGLGKPWDYLKRAQELKMDALAITDHGNAFGLIDFYKTAKEIGVKPILGVEAYLARFGRFQKRANVDTKPYHLVLLARDLEGYQNILQLVTKANLEGYYYKPRMDLELLEKFGGGLIALSACLQGEIPQHLLSENYVEAEEAVRRYQKFFGAENFYLEVQNHPSIPEQAIANARIIELARKMKVPLVATNDCHYVRPEDAEAQDVLLCVQTGNQVAEQNRMSMRNEDFSLKTPEEMQMAFAEVPEAIENTLKIAERCNVELPLGKRLLPTYQTPFQKKPEDYFRELCYEGINHRFGIPIPPEFRRIDGEEVAPKNPKAPPSKEETKRILERLEYELQVINKMGFASYFLIVWDFVKYAKEAGITVGPGRGSAAGSIIAFALGITDINPLDYGLLFERFLNPERVSMPDIDIDFADNRRDEVLEYVGQKYGRDHVARIITFGTLAAKAAVKDVGRVYGIPFAEMNNFTKLIPSRPGITLAEAFEAESQLRFAVEKEPFKKIWAIARKLEGVIRQAGVHACAVVIADKSLPHYTPLQTAPGDSAEIITQFSMHPIDDIGLLKMDFLGLRNLTIIQKCLNIIRRTRKTEIDISALPMDDKKTFELFQKPETTGVFQFESSGMKRYLKDLKPTRFEDLIAMVALFRPGPMENIPAYIRGKNSPDSVQYPYPILEEFLKETHGIAVYQEQVQKIAQAFAGFSLGQGYLMIKAVAKKIPKLLNKQRQLFIDGAIKKGHTKKEAEKLFSIIEPFAGYGFNKSHAACYAMIAYQTGYLKAHFPSEFLAALLTSDHGNLDRLAIDIEEAAKMSIRVLPPSVNESLANFTVVGGGDIRFGMNAIKGVGEGPIAAILSAREAGGKFSDLADFASRVDPSVINKRTLEALAFSGAMDDLGERAAIAVSASSLAEFAKASKNSIETTQGNLFDHGGEIPKLEFQLEKIPPASRSQKLKWEKELLGMYVSAHPLAGLRKVLGKKFHLAEKLEKKNIGKTLTVGGIVTNFRKILTKKSGQMMAFLKLEDPTGVVEVSIFPKVFSQFGEKIEKDELLTATGRLEFRNDTFQISAHEIGKIDLERLRSKAEADGFIDDSNGRAEPKIIEEITEIKLVQPIQIKLPADLDAAILPKLKQLLVASKSETGAVVEILIPENSKKVKRVKVPFLVGVGDDLEKEILNLVVGVELA